jgi:hypothetical protein
MPGPLAGDAALDILPPVGARGVRAARAFAACARVCTRARVRRARVRACVRACVSTPEIIAPSPRPRRRRRRPLSRPIRSGPAAPSPCSTPGSAGSSLCRREGEGGRGRGAGTSAVGRPRWLAMRARSVRRGRPRAGAGRQGPHVATRDIRPTRRSPPGSRSRGRTEEISERVQKARVSTANAFECLVLELATSIALIHAPTRPRSPPRLSQAAVR